MNNTVMVFFGATGDLMSKKLSPSLFQMFRTNKIPENTSIIGFSRRPYTNNDFCAHVNKDIKKIFEDAKQEELDKFNKYISFVSSQFDDSEGYKNLLNEISTKSEKFEETKILFFYSVAPEFYGKITSHLSDIKSDLNKISNNVELRLLIEKPFGNNQKEAKSLFDMLTKDFIEEEIYIIDHYLLKRMVKNIFAFRFSNNTFEPGWNNLNIERVEIETNEDFGVENRGAFYDQTGALMDVGQNHLLEILALLSMDKPTEFTSKEIRKERAKVLSKLEKIKEEKIHKQTFRAQYQGYKDIENVKPNSSIETYFKIVTFLDTPRWRNVPFILSAGKKLDKTKKEIRVYYKQDPSDISKVLRIHNIQNNILFKLPPEDGIEINFDLIYDNKQNLICQVKDQGEYKQYVEEYMNVFLDAIEGDQTWFVSIEEVIATWEFIDPIVNLWEKNKTELHYYDQNTSEIIDKADDHLSNSSIHFQTDKYPNKKGQLGLIGLGKMGNGIARNLHEHGWDVIAQNRSNDKVDNFIKFGGKGAYEIKELIEKLERPRKVWVMVPSGKPVDETIFGEHGLVQYLEEGDIIIDAGNSNFKNTVERASKLKEKGIKFIDAGVSGGPSGARNGACIMIGGDKETFEEVEQIFKDASLPGGYKFFPGIGAGHFVKMVHNGIEYGMMQAIGEGFGLMKQSDFNLNLTDVTEVYNRGSVIESRLIGWLLSAFKEYTEELKGISGEVSHSGEGQWTVETAKDMNLLIKVIEESLQFRIDSQGNPSYIGQIVSALRNQFGGHDVTNNK